MAHKLAVIIHNRENGRSLLAAIAHSSRGIGGYEECFAALLWPWRNSNDRAVQSRFRPDSDTACFR
jgi:hypothetical protein